MNKKNRNFEDILLTGAFEEYLRREDEKLPSDGELREEFPPREEECRKYAVTARRGERRFSAVKTLKWVAIIVMAATTITFVALMADKNVRAATLRSIKQFFTRKDSDNVYVTFDQDEDGGFFKDVDLSDLSVGYVPEGLTLWDDTKAAEDYPGCRFIVLYNPETNPDIQHRLGPTYILVYIQEGDKEVDYSLGSFEATEELTINGMAAVVFDLSHVVRDGSELDGQMLEVGDLAFGDKNFTIRLHWIALCDDGSFKDEAIKVAESIR